jgi:hypothetical protein
LETYFGKKTLESFDLVLAGIQFTSGQLEEGGAELEQENVWQSMLVNKQNAFNRSTHPDLFELIAHSLESRRHRWIFFKKRFLRSECVIRQWIPEKDSHNNLINAFNVKEKNTHKLIVLLRVSD